MIPYFASVYGNPASTHHFGKGINKIVDESRRKIADFIGCMRWCFKSLHIFV